jgi:hypothetical protein
MDADAASARRLLIGVLDTARATGEKTFVHVAIHCLAVAVSMDGDPTVAATLYGAAEHQYEQAGQAFDASTWNCGPALMPGCSTRSGKPNSTPRAGVAARSAKPMP